MRNELRTRVITAVVVAPFVVACFVSYESLVGLVSAVVLLAGYELLSFSLKGHSKLKIAFFTALTALYPSMYGIFFRSSPTVPMSILIMAGVIYCLLEKESPERASESYFALFITMVYVSVNLSFFIPLYSIMGPAVALLTLTAVWAFDVFAYFTGLSLGKRKIFTTYTNKTLEGVMGGFLGTLVYTALYKIVAEAMNFEVFDWADVFIFSVIVSVMGTLGDVFESSLKRRFGVKDSGVIMPGHGGMLDRIDGLLFTVPIVYLVLAHFGGV